MIVIIIGAVLLVGALALGASSARTLSRSIITVGEVTDLLASRGRKGGTTYKIKASFTDQQQQPCIYLASWSSSSPGYSVGDPIRISYAPGNPQSCGIASFGYVFGFATILGATGLAMLLIGGAYRVGNDVMERYFPVTAATVERSR
ncbi:MAG: DUF3592 domain-containing protein [Planctomycetes bacterium]|nr:DUF3592 domain-containing protein [Planctomycetota bacterium]